MQRRPLVQIEFQAVCQSLEGQLDGVLLADIFNLSLAQIVVPTGFNTGTTVPELNDSTAMPLNDSYLVTLTHIIASPSVFWEHGIHPA